MKYMIRYRIFPNNDWDYTTTVYDSKKLAKQEAQKMTMRNKQKQVQIIAVKFDKYVGHYVPADGGAA